MKQNLDDFLGNLKNFSDELSKVAEAKIGEVEKLKDELDKDTKRTVNYFQKEAMNAANKGDVTEVSKVLKAMIKRFKEMSDASTDK